MKKTPLDIVGDRLNTVYSLFLCVLCLLLRSPAGTKWGALSAP